MCATRVLKGTQQGGVGVCMQAERVRASRADIKHFAESTPVRMALRTLLNRGCEGWELQMQMADG